MDVWRKFFEEVNSPVKHEGVIEGKEVVPLGEWLNDGSIQELTGNERVAYQPRKRLVVVVDYESGLAIQGAWEHCWWYGGQNSGNEVVEYKPADESLWLDEARKRNLVP